jgi:putative transposase
MPQRRACRLVGLHPKTYRYASKRSDDGALRSKLRELALQRRRFGYRRLGLLLARQGIKLNHKKLYRLYREERLTVRRRGGRKRALGTRAPMVIPQGQNLRSLHHFLGKNGLAGRDGSGDGNEVLHLNPPIVAARNRTLRDPKRLSLNSCSR